MWTPQAAGHDIAMLAQKAAVARDTRPQQFGVFRNLAFHFGQQGIADIGIDLFVGLCVLSRAASLGKVPGEQGVRAIGIARVFAQQAKRRMASIVRRITRNEDEELNRLAGFILDKGSYPWDVLS